MKGVYPWLKALLAIGLSFCAGLLVFYMPERNYRTLPEAWLPAAEQSDTDALFALPIKIFPDWSMGVRFLPSQPGNTELIAANMRDVKVGSAKCPNLYGTEERTPSACSKMTTIEGSDVYVIQRQASSHNLQVYMERGGTLFAATGLHTKEEAIRYLRSFVKVARRDVDTVLGKNRLQVERASETIERHELAEDAKKAEAFRHLPFDPLLPATLPAGWIRYSVGVSGSDAQSPTNAQVVYKKGTRWISMTLVPAATITLGTTCGPIPGNGVIVGCSKVSNEDYYLGGSNESNRISQYLYRPVGDVVAILQTTVRKDDGQPMLFSEDVLLAQRSIAKSLRPVAKERLRGAVFIGTTFDVRRSVRE